MPQSDIFVAGLLPLAAHREVIRSPTDPSAYDCVTMTFMLSGGATVLTSTQHAELHPGDLAVAGPDIWCAYQPHESVTLAHVQIHSELLRNVFAWIGRSDAIAPLISPDVLASRESPILVHLGRAAVTVLTPLLDELIDNVEERGSASPFARTARFLDILDAILPALTSSAEAESRASREPAEIDSATPAILRPRTGYRDEVTEVMTMLRHSLGHHWSLPELAERVSLSPSQLVRIFRSQVGVTPMAYLSEIRLQRLAYLLRTTRITVADAAAQVGAQPDYVSRFFRHRWGVTPTQYRNAQGSPSDTSAEYIR